VSKASTGAANLSIVGEVQATTKGVRVSSLNGVAAANGGPVDLVFEGGGVKGIGLAGAYSLLEERGYRVENAAGTSAGAITAALVAAGYTADELREIVFSLDYRSFEDRRWYEHTYAGFGFNVLREQGLYRGEAFYEWMKEKLAAKNVHTFSDLATTSEDPRHAARLQVIVSDVTARRLLVLPRDAEVLGLDPNTLEVALAVRMSMSIPIFFEPVRIENAKTNHEHLLVDGGMLSNFPVWLFDCDDDKPPRWPTFGMLLVEPDPKTPVTARLPEPERGPRGARGIVQLFGAMLHTMMEAHDRLYLEQATFARTIGIPTLGVGTTEFDLPRARAEALYQSGRDAASKFLETWDFEGYKREFRSGEPQTSRRDQVATQMKEAVHAG
jgi:NTE family protein